MPVTKSAKKALRQDRKRTQVNAKIRKEFKAAVRSFRENPTAQGLREASSLLDRTAKSGIIHKNKASRLKSRLARLLPKAPAKKGRSQKKKAPSKKKSS